MNQKERQFTREVLTYYRAHGRHNLPWRQKSHLKPYNILVSEMMLQQTQVARVEPKYRTFLGKWGTARQLAAAPLGDVLRAWQGLGYNRRAKLLWEAAGMVADHSGRFPRTYEELKALPGIGPYTAAAIMNFAYNISTPMIETNIRTVFLHHFFKDATDVHDRDIVRLTVLYEDTQNPREWYWALMDYGAYLKQTHGNQNKRSRHYIKQSKFKGSNREIRGAILREISKQSHTKQTLHKKLKDFETTRVDEQLAKLLSESLIAKESRYYTMPH